MHQLNRYLRAHPKLVQGFLWGYLVFFGCFVFPFGNERFPLDFTKAYLVAASYGFIGLGFAGVYGAKRAKIVYPITLGLTAVGMFCRYLLEFGEVSNTWNFTPFNIASYLLIVPVFTVVVYSILANHLTKSTGGPPEP